MSDSKNRSFETADSLSSAKADEGGSTTPRKGPLSFLSGAITSGLLAWLCLALSQKVVVYFSLHSPDYSSAMAQSIASGFKTLVIGMCFLATFSFAFIGFGLTLVFIRSLFAGKEPDAA